MYNIFIQNIMLYYIIYYLCLEKELRLFELIIISYPNYKFKHRMNNLI